MQDRREQKTLLADDRTGQGVPHTPSPSPNPVGLAREIGVQCTGNPLYYHLGTSGPPVLACKYHVLPVLESTQLHVIPFSLPDLATGSFQEFSKYYQHCPWSCS